MKIEHFAMYVLDLEGAKDFFVRYFNATPGELYHNKQTGFKSYFLSFGDGSRLEVMTRPGLAKSEASSLRCGYIHLAFGVANDEAVDALTERLRGDGYEVASGPRATGDGCYESCIVDLEGNLIEIVSLSHSNAIQTPLK